MPDPEDFRNKVLAFIESRRLLRPGMKVVVGVSGGVDSVALLHVLKEATTLSLSLHVAHLNHLLRPEAGEEARFVRSLARSWGIPVTTGYADVRRIAAAKKTSVEAAGRIARYSFLRHVARMVGADRIAVAHHADDRVETILLNILRGTGPSGLSGIPVRNGNVVRPLLCVTRAEIEGYCREAGLKWCVDPSNLSTDYQRNKIRHILLPLLRKEFNPRVEEALLRLAEIVEEEDLFLSEYALRVGRRLVKKRGKRELRLDLSRFLRLPRPLQRRLLRSAVVAVAGGLKDFGYIHVEDSIRLLSEGGVGAEVHLPCGVRVRKSYRDFAVFKGEMAPEKRPPVERRIAVPGTTELPELGFTVFAQIVERDGGGRLDLPDFSGSPWVAFFDYDELRLPLFVRTRRPGDRIRPFGMEGSKKLKKLFGDLKIPLEERDRIPLVASDGEIYWVVGCRRSRDALVTPETRRVLVLRFLKN
ncbi:MAG: tRNA lysidine(34) synthetase TilS [Thermacetogeniaceae bacterium]